MKGRPSRAAERQVSKRVSGGYVISSATALFVLELGSICTRPLLQNRAELGRRKS